IPTVLAGGVVAGAWERRERRVRAEPFRDLSAEERRALPAAAERIGEILETKKLGFDLGTIEVRPHL
ncbi:MAG TPA: crosslink repair DNA glycosylase YcaQ family protein, partial [Candidatus Dormibacteraeota bacterium]